MKTLLYVINAHFLIQETFNMKIKACMLNQQYWEIAFTLKMR